MTAQRFRTALLLVLLLVLLLAPASGLAGGAFQAAPDLEASAQPVTAADAHATDPDGHQLLVMLRLPPAHFRPDASYGGRYLDDNGRAARRRRAEALARQHGLTLVDDWPMPALGLDCYLMRYPGEDNAERLIALLERDRQVEWAQPVARFDGMAQPAARPGGDSEADTLYPVQPAARFWHLAELHRFATGRGVKVAVIDSGIDGAHPDLLGQLAVNLNFVDAGPAPAERHGTAVAGIIAARAGHGGIVGVAPGARLMGLRACWQPADQNLATRCDSFTLAKALNYAVLNGARVINLSLAGPPDRLLDRLLDAALARRIAVVGALDPQADGPRFPASHRGVLAVAAQPAQPIPPPARMTATTPVAAAQVLLAPGNDVPTSAPGGRWSFVSGNSYAAAHVAGMLALLGELRPDAASGQLREMLRPAALNADSIDACATISRLVRDCSCACPVTVLTQRGAGP